LLPGRGRDLSVCHHIQTGSRAHMVAYVMGIEELFLGDKEAGT